MKFCRRYFLVFVSLLCVIMLTGCGFFGKNKALTPTEVVTNKIETIKSGDSDDILNGFNNGIFKFKKNAGLKELFPSSSEKMKKLLNNITYKVNSEKINGDEAVVNVTLNGPDLNEPFDKLIQNVISDVKSGELSVRDINLEKITEKYDENFSKSLDNVKNSERTVDIELEKTLGKWEIKDEDDLCKLTTNIDVDDFVDKYEGSFKK